MLVDLRRKWKRRASQIAFETDLAQAFEIIIRKPKPAQPLASNNKWKPQSYLHRPPSDVILLGNIDRQPQAGLGISQHLLELRHLLADRCHRGGLRCLAIVRQNSSVGGGTSRTAPRSARSAGWAGWYGRGIRGGRGDGVVLLSRRIVSFCCSCF